MSNEKNGKSDEGNKAITERLRALVRERYGGNQSHFALALGVEQSFVTKWFHSTAASIPSAKSMALICRRTHASPTWLLMGVGPIMVDSQTDEDLREGISGRVARWAPLSIPHHERERFGWLVNDIKLDRQGSRLVTSQEEATRIALELVTAQLAVLRRARGDQRVEASALLDEFHRYRPQAASDFFTFSLLTARMIVEPGRVPKAKAATRP